MKIDAIPIKEVRINEHALKNIQFHPTLINFFYGKNGSGKTSIGKHLKDHNPSDKELCLFNDDYMQAEPRISSPSEGKMTRHWKEK